MGKPQQVKDPRSDAAGQLAQLIQTGLSGGYQSGDIGRLIQDQFAMPAYQGDLGTGITPAQQQLTDQMQQLFLNASGQMGQGTRDQSLANLQNIVNFGNGSDQSRLSDMLGSLAGGNVLNQIAGGNNFNMQQLQNMALTSPDQTAQAQQFLQSGNGNAINQLLNPQNMAAFSAAQGLVGQQGNPAIAQLLGISSQGNQQNSSIIQQLLGNSNVQTPERALLQQAASSNPLLPAQSVLGSLAGNQNIQNLLNGGGINMQAIAQPLEAARQQALQSDQQNIAEQFSTAGLRNSTSLLDAQNRAAEQSRTGLQAQLAQMVPQIMGLQQQGQLGALQGLAGIGGQLGQLGLGRQANVLQGLGQAGQLGLGAGSLSNQSLLGAGQLSSSDMSSIVQALGQAGQLQLGESSRQSDLAQALAGLGIQSVGQAGQLQGQELGQQRDLASQLAQLGITQQGQNANILQGLLGQQLGAAQSQQQGGLASAGLLQQLMQSGQSNQLQAALGLPGATAQMQSLPMQLAQMFGQQVNTNQQTQQQSNLLQYQDFLRQQQLFPQLLSFLGGMSPAQVGPSQFSQIMNGVISAGALAAGFL